MPGEMSEKKICNLDDCNKQSTFDREQPGQFKYLNSHVLESIDFGNPLSE
jgi:hypothetical protein